MSPSEARSTGRWAPLLMLAVAACSSSPPDPAGGAGGTDGGPAPDGGEPASALRFTVDVVEGLGTEALVGDFARVGVNADGRFAVAYGFAPVGGGEREIHYAESDEEGAWRAELVTIPGAQIPGGDDLKGLGFDFVEGVPHVAFLGGDDDGRTTVEEPTDLVLATRVADEWTTRTLVDVSSEAVGDCSEYCDEGFVVGSQAALRAGPARAGFAVVYRDTHIGFARDDLELADVEVYSEGLSTPRNSVVDAERGGGEHANLVYTSAGTLVVAYNLASDRAGRDQTGVWVATLRDGQWLRQRVWEHQTSARVALTARGDRIALALFDTSASDLVVLVSDDDGQTWASERVATAGKTGLFPSATFDAGDRVVVAFTYCGPSSERSCPGTLGSSAKVRIAREDPTGWQTYDVDDGQGFGRVGLFTSIAVDGDGKLGVAFVDDANGDLLFAKER